MKKFKYLNLIIIIFVFISCKEKVVVDSIKNLENTNSTNLEIILPEIQFYGETLPVDLIISDSVAKQFGFKLKRVGGDVVNEKIILNVKKNNQKTLQALNNKYGKGWIENFEEKTGKTLKYYLIQE